MDIPYLFCYKLVVFQLHNDPKYLNQSYEIQLEMAFSFISQFKNVDLSFKIDFYTPGIRSMPWRYIVFVFSLCVCVCVCMCVSVCLSVNNFRVRSITLKPLDIFS